jgi:hypothetical protein
MNIRSLTLKNQLIDEETGQNYWDLSAPSFNYKAALGLKAIHYVTQDQAMRPDLISLLYYSSSDYTDAICVINNIFNPFSLQEGDVLAIPILSNPELVYSRPSPQTRVTATIAPYIETSRQSEQDQGRINRLIKKAETKKNPVQTPLPPNMLQQGQTAKVFEDNKIKLGQNLNSRKN